MAGMIESISTLNSFVRTILAVIVIGGASVGGWFGYTTYFAAKIDAEKKAHELDVARKDLAAKEEQLAQKEEQIVKLGKDIVKLNEKIEKLDMALRLLKVDLRLARLTVLEQGDDADTGEKFSRIEFEELNDRGEKIDQPKRFKILGDMVYVEYLVVKFDDKYVEQADIDRSTSLCLFQRIFGEKQKPIEGFVLDEVGTRPAIYGRGKAPSEFEAKIWNDFWNIANDPEKAKDLGIRANHSEAPGYRVQAGKSYKLELRASGGLTIKPENDAPKTPVKPAA